jgi:hypothetical protein
MLFPDLMLSALTLVAVQPTTGQPNLGPEELVQSDGIDIQVPGYSVPSLARWDGDALEDLIVGEGGGGVSEAKVRVYLNSGSLTAPQFTTFFYAQSRESDLVATGQGCLGLFPRVVHWDGDGRKDLLVGLADGRIKIYLNTSADDDPIFDGGTSLEVGPPGLKVEIDVGYRATPTVVDWNNDGKGDLVVGALTGKVHVFLNEGTTGSPEFISEAFVQEDGADLVVPCDRSSPHVADLDGDGRKDLLTGNTCGEVLLYGNVGTDAAPGFSGYTYVASEDLPIDLPGTPRSRPFVCDWTRDGQWDVLVGAGDGKVHLYQEDDPPSELFLFVSKEDNDVRFDWATSEMRLYDVLYATSPNQDPFDPLPNGQNTTPPVYHEDVLGDGMDYCYLVRVTGS